MRGWQWLLGVSTASGVVAVLAIVGVVSGWAAVGAVATSIAALGALAGLVALWFLRSQVVLFREQLSGFRQQTRMQLAPYLRVDLAPHRTDGTWTPPEVPAEYQFTYRDFNPEAEAAPDIFEGWSSEDEVPVYLWLANRQTHPGGVARNIVVNIEVRTPAVDGSNDVVVNHYNVDLHYLEPERQIQYLVGSVSTTIPHLAARVAAVAYSDMYGNPLSFAHGSSAFTWDGSRLVNERVVFQNENVNSDEDRSG